MRLALAERPRRQGKRGHLHGGLQHKSIALLGEAPGRLSDRDRLKGRAQQLVQVDVCQPPLQRLVWGEILERDLALQSDRATGNTGLSLGDGQSPCCHVQPDGEISELCLLAHAQCSVGDRHSHLTVEPGSDRALHQAVRTYSSQAP